MERATDELHNRAVEKDGSGLTQMPNGVGYQNLFDEAQAFFGQKMTLEQP